MIKPRGGRGKKAPYKTQQMRVPIPIKDQVNNLISDFRNEVLGVHVKNNDFVVDQLLVEKLQNEIKNLNVSLELANNQIIDLSLALENAQLEIKNLNTGLDATQEMDTYQLKSRENINEINLLKQEIEFLNSQIEQSKTKQLELIILSDKSDEQYSRVELIKKAKELLLIEEVVRTKDRANVKKAFIKLLNATENEIPPPKSRKSSTKSKPKT